MARTTRSTSSTSTEADDDDNDVVTTTSDLVATNDPAVPTAHVPVPADQKDPEGSGTSFTMEGGTKVSAEPHVIDKLKRQGA